LLLHQLLLVLVLLRLPQLRQLPLELRWLPLPPGVLGLGVAVVGE
jgi:hypothetical protein